MTEAERLAAFIDGTQRNPTQSVDILEQILNGAPPPELLLQALEREAIWTQQSMFDERNQDGSTAWLMTILLRWFLLGVAYRESEPGAVTIDEMVERR